MQKYNKQIRMHGKIIYTIQLLHHCTRGMYNAQYTMRVTVTLKKGIHLKERVGNKLGNFPSIIFTKKYRGAP